MSVLHLGLNLSSASFCDLRAYFPGVLNEGIQTYHTSWWCKYLMMLNVVLIILMTIFDKFYFIKGSVRKESEQVQISEGKWNSCGLLLFKQFLNNISLPMLWANTILSAEELRIFSSVYQAPSIVQTKKTGILLLSLVQRRKILIRSIYRTFLKIT